MSWKTILLGCKIFMYLPTTEESALVIKPFMTRGRSPAARSKIFLLGKFPAKTIIILDHLMTVVVHRDKSIRPARINYKIKTIIILDPQMAVVVHRDKTIRPAIINYKIKTIIILDSR